jgi:O-antigen/teichoic acid export membrane protein
VLPKLKDIATTLVARGVAMGGPLIVGIITARALGPEDRGQYFLVMSYALIASQIANLGLQASNTYLVANRRELLGPLFVNGLYVAAIITPLVALVIVLALGWPQALGIAASQGNSTGPVALAAVLLAPLILMLVYISNLAVAIGRVSLYNVLTIGYSLLAVVVAAVLWAEGGGTLSFLLGAAFSAAAVCAVVAWRLLSGCHLRARFDVDLFKKGFVFAFKAYLTTMFGSLMMRVGILALQQHASMSEVGLFSIAVQLTDGIAQLPATIGMLMFPLMLRTETVHRRAAMWRALWGLGSAMFVLLVLGGIASYWLIPFLFGESFAGSYPFTIALFPQLLLLSFMTVISQYLAAEGYPWTQVVAWVIGFVIQTVLSYWLARVWGGIGVAIALTVSSSVVLGILLFEVFRKGGDTAAMANNKQAILTSDMSNR